MQGSFIGVVSKDTGLSIDTIRFYEKVGLIRHPARSGGRFRVFSPKDIRDLLLVRRLLDLGFSLNEIKRLLHLRSRHVNVCVEIRNLLRIKLANVRQRIRLLQLLEDELGRGPRK